MLIVLRGSITAVFGRLSINTVKLLELAQVMPRRLLLILMAVVK